MLEPEFFPLFLEHAIFTVLILVSLEFIRFIRIIHLLARCSAHLRGPSVISTIAVLYSTSQVNECVKINLPELIRFCGD